MVAAPPPVPTARQPLEYDYNEFERLLLGAAWMVYSNRKKAPGGAGGGGAGGGGGGEVPFEEQLGEMLDAVFKKAGVLVPVAPAPGSDDDEEAH
jgi:hypothetical protein